MGHVFCHHRESGRAELLPRLSSPPLAIELDSSQCWATLQALQDTQAFEFEVS